MGSLLVTSGKMRNENTDVIFNSKVNFLKMLLDEILLLNRFSDRLGNLFSSFSLWKKKYDG